MRLSRPLTTPAPISKRATALNKAVGLVTAVAILSTQAAYAGCVLETSRVVRARLIRCEIAQFYWDASVDGRAVDEAIERELEGLDPPTREVRRQRIYEGVPVGPSGPQSKFVALVHVDWQVTTTPFQPPYTGMLALVGEPQRVGETFRYLWHGPPETCETPPPSGSPMDLWVSWPCCDTLFSFEDGCVVQMGYVEPAPAPLREVLVKALEEI